MSINHNIYNPRPLGRNKIDMLGLLREFTNKYIWMIQGRFSRSYKGPKDGEPRAELEMHITQSQSLRPLTSDLWSRTFDLGPLTSDLWSQTFDLESDLWSDENWIKCAIFRVDAKAISVQQMSKNIPDESQSQRWIKCVIFKIRWKQRLFRFNKWVKIFLMCKKCGNKNE